MLGILSRPFACSKCWGARKKETKMSDGKDEVKLDSCNTSAFMDFVLHTCSADSHENEKGPCDLDSNKRTMHRFEQIQLKDMSTPLHTSSEKSNTCDVENVINYERIPAFHDTHAMQVNSMSSSDSACLYVATNISACDEFPSHTEKSDEGIIENGISPRADGTQEGIAYLTRCEASVDSIFPDYQQWSPDSMDEPTLNAENHLNVRLENAIADASPESHPLEVDLVTKTEKDCFSHRSPIPSSSESHTVTSPVSLTNALTSLVQNVRNEGEVACVDATESWTRVGSPLLPLSRSVVLEESIGITRHHHDGHTHNSRKGPGIDGTMEPHFEETNMEVYPFVESRHNYGLELITNSVDSHLNVDAVTRAPPISSTHILERSTCDSGLLEVPCVEREGSGADVRVDWPLPPLSKTVVAEDSVGLFQECENYGLIHNTSLGLDSVLCTRPHVDVNQTSWYAGGSSQIQSRPSIVSSTTLLSSAMIPADKICDPFLERKPVMFDSPQTSSTSAFVDTGEIRIKRESDDDLSHHAGKMLEKMIDCEAQVTSVRQELNPVEQGPVLLSTDDISHEISPTSTISDVLAVDETRLLPICSTEIASKEQNIRGQIDVAEFHMKRQSTKVELLEYKQTGDGGRTRATKNGFDNDSRTNGQIEVGLAESSCDQTPQISITNCDDNHDQFTGTLMSPPCATSIFAGAMKDSCLGASIRDAVEIEDGNPILHRSSADSLVSPSTSSVVMEDTRDVGLICSGQFFTRGGGSIGAKVVLVSPDICTSDDVPGIGTPNKRSHVISNTSSNSQVHYLSDSWVAATPRVTPLSSITVLAGKACDFRRKDDICADSETVHPDENETRTKEAELRLLSPRFVISQGSSIPVVAPSGDSIRNESVVSQLPIENRKLKFWIEDKNDLARMRLLEAVASLGKGLPTIVLQHILDEVITDSSFGFFDSSDDDDIMSFASVESSLSDIDERVYGRSPKVTETPTAHARSLGGGLMTSLHLATQHDSRELQSKLGDERLSFVANRSTPTSQPSVCRSIGGGQIPMIQRSPGCNSEDDENSNIIMMDSWNYGSLYQKETWCADFKTLSGFLTVDDALLVARKLFLADTAEKSISSIQSTPNQANPDLDYAAELRLALRSLGINLKRPKELLELAYFDGGEDPKDPFPYDSEHESDDGAPQHAVKVPRELESEPGASRSFSGSVDADDSFVVFDNGRTFASRRSSAILSIEISGSTMPYNWNELKLLLESIFNQVSLYGGDILSIAGGTLIAEWTPLNPEPVRALGETCFVPTSLGECALAAAMCGASIVADSSNAKDGLSSKEATSSFLKCALGAGEVLGVHVGGYQLNRKYVIMGDAIDQVFEGSRCARFGEVMSSGPALKVLSSVCTIQGHVSPNLQKPCIIATRDNIFWEIKEGRKSTTEAGSRDLVLKAVRKLSTAALEQFCLLMTHYAKPTMCTYHEEDSGHQRHDTNTLDFKSLEHTFESRTTFVMCVGLFIPAHLSGNEDEDGTLIELIGAIVELIGHELIKCNGRFHDFFLDECAFVLFATFGLQGSNNPTDLSELAIPAAISIHNRLLQELHVRNRVGLTFGKVDTGVVAGMNRSDLATSGPPVHLSMQLVYCDLNPGILVDHAVRSVANLLYAFNALGAVDVPGPTSAVSIFEPLSPLRRSWGRVPACFVGRTDVILALSGAAKEMSLEPSSESRMLFLCGDSGMGKSATLAYALEHIRRVMKASDRPVSLIHNRCEEFPTPWPFQVFASLVLNALEATEEYQHGSQVDFQKSIDCIHPQDLELQLAGRNHDGLPADQIKRMDRLKAIFRDLDAPVELSDFLLSCLSWLSALSSPVRKNLHNMERSITTVSAAVPFMARVLARCLAGSVLTIVALDDVHHMDEFSWQVLEEVFDVTKNVLFICTVKGFSPAGSSISNTFWRKLSTDHQRNGRFKSMLITELLDDDMRHLTVKKLGVQLDAIPPHTMQTIIAQSRGNPSVASAFLEFAKYDTSNCIARKLGLALDAFHGIHELLSCRVAALDSGVRNVIEIGAIHGKSFDFFELVDFIKYRGANGSPEECTVDTIAAVQSAIDQGIIHVAPAMRNDDENDFHHSGAALRVWPLSLDSQRSENQQLRFFCYFAENSWHSTILASIEISRKRELHRAVARWKQARAPSELCSIAWKVSMFWHWRAGESKVQATKEALSIVRDYEECALYSISCSVLQDALEMWNLDAMHASNDAVDTFSTPDVIEMTKDDLEQLISLLFAFARTLAMMGEANQSIMVSEQGLAIAKCAHFRLDFDRSIVFPLFVDIISAINLGGAEKDRKASFEEAAVTRLVREALLYGDSVHYTQALAMEADLLSRQGKFREAVFVHSELVQIYDPKELTASLTKAYGSDRVAQCFGQSASWYAQIDEPEAALEVCEYVRQKLLPTMATNDLRSTILILYPVIWVLKDYGLVDVGADLFKRYVLDNLVDYGNELSSDPIQQLIEPTKILLDLSLGAPSEAEASMLVRWALETDKFNIDFSLNCTLASISRCLESVLAEICLLLARNRNDLVEHAKLVQNGFEFAAQALNLSQERQFLVARRQILSVHKCLVEMSSALTVQCSEKTIV